MMRILAINVNDLGGKNEQLMKHRYFSNRDQNWHIDWEYWSRLDKTENWRKLKEYIQKKSPDIFFVEEMLVSCFEKINFITELKEMGYSYIYESLPERGNYSLTMAFYKSDRNKPCYIESLGNYRKYRSVLCENEGIIFSGSHFPYESDEVFLKYMYGFFTSNLDKEILLIGDLNANDPERGNKKMVNKLLEKGAVDLWIAAGNSEDMATEAKYSGRLDYAIASPLLASKIQNIEIDPYPMESGMTDHAAIIVDIKD